MRNSLDMAMALYAGMAARAQVAPLNPTYTDREIEPLVRDVDPRLIVCDSEFAERAQPTRATHRRTESDRRWDPMG